MPGYFQLTNHATKLHGFLHLRRQSNKQVNCSNDYERENMKVGQQIERTPQTRKQARKIQECVQLRNLHNTPGHCKKTCHQGARKQQ